MVIWFLCLLAMLARWRRKSGAEWKVYVRDAIATKEREREGARGEGGRSKERAKNVKLYLNWIGVCAAKRFHHPPNQITIIHVVTSFLSSTQSWHYFSLFFTLERSITFISRSYMSTCVLFIIGKKCRFPISANESRVQITNLSNGTLCDVIHSRVLYAFIFYAMSPASTFVLAFAAIHH